LKKKPTKIPILLFFVKDYNGNYIRNHQSLASGELGRYELLASISEKEVRNKRSANAIERWIEKSLRAVEEVLVTEFEKSLWLSELSWMGQLKGLIQQWSHFWMLVSFVS